MSKGLTKFAKLLEDNGLLLRTSEEDAKAVADGKAIIYKPQKSVYQVLKGAATEETGKLMLGIKEYSELAAKYKEFKGLIQNLSSSASSRRKFMAAAKKIASSAPCEISGVARCHQSVKYIASFAELPLKRSQENIVAIDNAVILTNDPVSESPDYEICRVELIEETKARIIFKEGSRAEERLKNCTHRLPMAICIGGDPIYSLVAAMHVPPYISKHLMAGVLRNSPVKLAKCFTQNLMVPEDLDIVIEGYIQKSEAVFHVSNISHASDAIYPESFDCSGILSQIKSACGSYQVND